MSPLPNASPRWRLLMAWRDSRGRKRTLGLFALAVTFGIGALVANNSFRDNLDTAIELRARSLLGADLLLRSNQPFSDAMEAFMGELGGEQSREIRFRSMASFPAQEQTRLVQVRALEGGFPFYGELETDPAAFPVAAAKGDIAVVEESLMIRYGLALGDEVRLGRKSFSIAASLLRVPGESEVTGAFAPRIYIPRAALEDTGLIEFGSIANFLAFFRFDSGLDPPRKEAIERAETSLFADENIRVSTVESRQQGVERILDNIGSFLGLVGFVALLLGGLGVAGSVHVYVKEKLATVATLRCLGASAGTAFTIFLLQVAVVGLLGGVAGVLLGVATQQFLPLLVGSFLPFTLDTFLSWGAIAQSLFLGWSVAVLFALLPLLAVRRVSPLRALRADLEPPRRLLRKDPARAGVLLALVGLTLGFALLQTPKWWIGLAFCAALAVSLGLLGLLASGLRASLRRLRTDAWPYPWRLGIANLYRPNNRTLLLVVLLGMGAFLIYTLELTRGVLLAQVEISDTGEAPNLILVDIQPSQISGVRAAVLANGHPVDDVVPVATMRLESLRGRPIGELRGDDSAGVERWVFGWEFRVTWREQLLDNERITAGTFTPRYSGDGPAPISLSPNIADAFNVSVGDSLVWDVEGLPIEATVGSIRDVDWSPSRLNFGIVWPAGVLEEAPVVYALVTRTVSRADSIALQQALIDTFPNVSAVDLSLAFDALSDILARVKFVVQFMAAFTVATGLVVLATAIITSRYQRVRESILLRTLGASGGLVRRVMALEYALLGTLAGLAGVALSLAAGWALSRYVFEADFSASALSALAAVAVTLALTVATGLANSRRIATHPPLDILREER